MNSLFAWLNSPQDWLIILIIGVLLFGRRLPEIGRYLGKGIVEFKKGLKGVEDEVESATNPSAPAPGPARPDAAVDQPRPPQRVTASTPKFDDAAPKFETPAPKFDEKPANVSTPPPA
jgi:sec-independent protein translocase protein TatA